jgi:hypothetical protein
MATSIFVRVDLVHRDLTGRLVSIELVDPGPDRIDTCDCHRLVWPAQTLTYATGADQWDCPLYLAG